MRLRPVVGGEVHSHFHSTETSSENAIETRMGGSEQKGHLSVNTFSFMFSSLRRDWGNRAEGMFVRVQEHQTTGLRHDPRHKIHNSGTKAVFPYGKRDNQSFAYVLLAFNCKCAIVTEGRDDTF